MTGLNLSEWALKHRSLTVYLMIVFVAAGVISYLRLGRSEDPSFVINTMVVHAAWPGASVEDTFKEVTERLRGMIGPIQFAAAVIAELDSVFARARFARDFDACMPEFSDAGELQLEAVRHPVLEDKLRK